MERLTERNKSGYVTTCFWETNTENGTYDMDEVMAEEIINRLAAYEDTGLEPEEVQIVAEMFAGDPYVPILQVSNLVKACREDRAEILPPNDPLTLEELREMDGEPVWCIIIDGDYKGESFWGLVSIDTAECICSNWDVIIFAYYGKTWLAYRRKPKEESL